MELSSSTPTVSEIIARAGGPAAIAKRAATIKEGLSVWAIHKWRKNGIPSRYWTVLSEMAGVSISQLHAACAATQAGQQGETVTA